MFSVVKNYLGNLRELDFGQMESHFTVDLFVKTLVNLPNAQPVCVAQGIIKLEKAL